MPPNSGSGTQLSWTLTWVDAVFESPFAASPFLHAGKETADTTIASAESAAVTLSIIATRLSRRAGRGYRAATYQRLSTRLDRPDTSPNIAMPRSAEHPTAAKSRAVRSWRYEV